jgi:hypothetical protein
MRPGGVGGGAQPRQSGNPAASFIVTGTQDTGKAVRGVMTALVLTNGPWSPFLLK